MKCVSWVVVGSSLWMQYDVCSVFCSHKVYHVVHHKVYHRVHHFSYVWRGVLCALVCKAFVNLIVKHNKPTCALCTALTFVCRFLYIIHGVRETS